MLPPRPAEREGGGGGEKKKSAFQGPIKRNLKLRAYYTGKTCIQGGSSRLINKNNTHSFWIVTFI